MSLREDIKFLACTVMTGDNNEAEEMYNNDTYVEMLESKYGIEVENYVQVIKDLIPYLPTAMSAINKEHFHAFISNGNAILKVSREDVAKRNF